jgi:hypothetical protein
LPETFVSGSPFSTVPDAMFLHVLSAFMPAPAALRRSGQGRKSRKVQKIAVSSKDRLTPR